MIGGITSSDPFIRISNGDSAGVYYNTTNPSAGLIRYYNNCFQVYDGYNWLNVPNNVAIIGMSDHAVEAIEWALKKIKEEKRVEELARTNPSIQFAYDNFKKAEEHLKTTIYLSKHE